MLPKCEYCDGSGRNPEVVIHSHTHLKKIISVPCICQVSRVVSAEYKLLQHMTDQYLHPDKLAKQLDINLSDPSGIENYIIEGPYDTFLYMMKALIMKNRFNAKKPMILLSRSIDIVHDYHVPHGDEDARHLSATSVYDLAVIVFGSMEVNKALAPCMSEMISTRIQEKKPTWIYFQEILTPKSQEYSEETINLISQHFAKITIHSDKSVDKNSVSDSKRLASKF
jgi:hypothetical protein